MRSIRILALGALALTLAGCGSSDGGGAHPVPGFLNLTLNTPNSNDGALLFKVQGGTIDSAVAGLMVQSGSYVINPTFTRIVVAGDLTDGLVAKVHVPDVGNAADYTVTIEQAAARTTFAQQPLSGYSVTVTAP
jgi:hypothetical protein